MSARCTSCSFEFDQPLDRAGKWTACPRCHSAIPPALEKPFRPWKALLVTSLAVVIPLTIVKLLRPKEETPPAPKMVFTPLPEPDAKTKEWLAGLDSLAEQEKELERLKKEAKEQAYRTEAEKARLQQEIDDLVRETREKQRQAIERSRDR
jgi:hypothetical protein